MWPWYRKEVYLSIVPLSLLFPQPIQIKSLRLHATLCSLTWNWAPLNSMGLWIDIYRIHMHCEFSLLQDFRNILLFSGNKDSTPLGFSGNSQSRCCIYYGYCAPHPVRFSPHSSTDTAISFNANYCVRQGHHTMSFLAHPSPRHWWTLLVGSVMPWWLWNT